MSLPSARTVVVAAAAALFVACSLVPVGSLLIAALPVSGGASALLLDARQRGLLLNTACLGIGTALLSTAIGSPLGLGLARVGLTRSAFLRIALATPVLLPPYVAGLAWVGFSGNRGLFAALTGSEMLSSWTHSLPGAITVLSLVFYPLSMLATEVALRRVDGRLEEAALIVAPSRRVLLRITLPLVAPSVLGAALVVFVLAVSEFGVPGLLQVRVYTTEVFTAFAALYDFSRAVLLALPLLVLCLGVAVVAAAVLGDRLVVARRNTGTRPIELAFLRRHALTLAMLVLATALGLPLLVLFREALGAESVTSVLAGSGDAILKSLLAAAAGATAVVAVGVWLGYQRARSSRPIGLLMDVVFVVAFAVPSTIVGVGLIGLWNRPGPLGAIYGTDVMFVLAYMARFVPMAALALAASIRSISFSQEEAAAVCGAGWLRTIAGIVLPQARLGLAATWVIAFVLAFGELGTSILVAPPGEATLPIRVYTLIANTPHSHVAVLALLQTAVIFVPVAVLGAFATIREDR